MSESLTISKWGNSVAMRIPKAVLAKFNLSEGDVLRLLPSSDSSKLVFEPVRQLQKVENLAFSERDWAMILELLDNPPPPNERLKKAALALKESYNEA